MAFWKYHPMFLVLFHVVDVSMQALPSFQSHFLLKHMTKSKSHRMTSNSLSKAVIRHFRPALPGASFLVACFWSLWPAGHVGSGPWSASDWETDGRSWRIWALSYTLEHKNLNKLIGLYRQDFTYFRITLIYFFLDIEIWDRILSVEHS